MSNKTLVVVLSVAAGVLVLSCAGILAVAFLAGRQAAAVIEDERERGEETSAKSQAVIIAEKVEQYHRLDGKYPKSLADITWSSQDATLDPWGKPYKYDPPRREGERPRVYTTTPKGKVVSNLD